MRCVRIVMLLIVLLSIAPAALAANKPPKAPLLKVTVDRGKLTPNGIARVSGALPKGKAFKPGSYALSANTTFDRSDTIVGATSEKAVKGHYKAWLSLPDATKTGSFQLLACKAAKPAKTTCVAVGKVKIASAPAVPAATPTLDTTRAVQQTFTLQGGSVTATAADSTTWTLTVIPNSVEYETITLTPVTGLTPASAVGTVVAGVQIDPTGSDAPPGATLEIKHPAAYAKTARVVAFGIDPSDGAYPLAAAVKTDLQLPVYNFGGYAITVPATGPAADVPPKPVPCSTPTKPTATAAAAGSRPLLSCVSFAEKLKAMGEAIYQAVAQGDRGAIFDAFTAASQDIANAMNAVLKQPPTDEGAAELELELPFAIALERQANYLAVPDPATAAIKNIWQRAAKYQYDLVKSKCLAPAGSQPGDIYISYMYEALAVSRLGQLESGLIPSDIETVLQTCISRVKVQLTGDVDATLDTGQYTGHVVLHAVAMLTGNANLQFQSDKPNLTFNKAEVKPDPQLAAFGGTTSFASTTGTMDPDPINFDAVRKVRCDKNRHLVVERTTFALIGMDQLWVDSEPVAVTVGGQSGSPIANSTAGDAWANIYPAFPKPPRERLQITPAVPPFTKSAGGACGGLALECTTYSFSATLAVAPVMN